MDANLEQSILLKANAADVYNQVQVNNLVNAKQATIADGDLTIARTNGLQSALDSKLSTIADNSLTIAKTNGLQAALDNKLTTIADNSLTIAKTSGLQSALDGKQATIADGDLTIARTNGLQSALDSKLTTIADDSLTIAKTSGLQSALNNKAESSTLAHYVTSSVFGVSLAAKQDILSSASNLSIASVGLGSGANLAEYNNGSFRFLNTVHDLSLIHIRCIRFQKY